MNGIGALIGLLFGLGAHACVTGSGPVLARAYVRRLEPFMSPSVQRTPWINARWLGHARLDRIGARQLRAGLAVDPAEHVLNLLLWSAGGLASGAGVLAVLTVLGGIRQPAAALPLLAVCVVSAALVADRRLDRVAKDRREAAALELPTGAESLAIAVGAGASLPHACDLLAQRSSGVFADELGVVVRAVEQGQNIDSALAAMAERLPVPSVARFTDALRIALDRGTPVVDVLHAQAADARAESRRLLMEMAGRREVAMLVPVVFCVLPAVVVIALYPGFRELTSMV